MATAELKQLVVVATIELVQLVVVVATVEQALMSEPLHQQVAEVALTVMAVVAELVIQMALDCIHCGTKTKQEESFFVDNCNESCSGGS